MLTLYDFMGSGNGYKVWLLLAQLGLPYKRIECDILKGETRTPEFLAEEPERPHPDARARRRHVSSPSRTRSSGTSPKARAFAPADRLARAQTLQWMFFEQYSHEPYIAVARFWKHFFAKLTPQQEIELPEHAWRRATPRSA